MKYKGRRKTTAIRIAGTWRQRPLTARAYPVGGSPHALQRGAVKGRQCLPLQRGQALLVAVLEERGAEVEGDDTRAEERLVVDLAVLGEERRPRIRREHAPHDLEVERGLPAAEVDPVDHAAHAPVLDQQMAEVEVTVADSLRLWRWKRAGILDQGEDVLGRVPQRVELGELVQHVRNAHLHVCA